MPDSSSEFERNLGEFCKSIQWIVLTDRLFSTIFCVGFIFRVRIRIQVSLNRKNGELMKIILALVMLVSSTMVFVQPAAACPIQTIEQGGWQCEALCPQEPRCTGGIVIISR